MKREIWTDWTLQLDEDVGNSTRQSWMQTSGLFCDQAYDTLKVTRRAWTSDDVTITTTMMMTMMMMIYDKPLTDLFPDPMCRLRRWNAP